MAISNLPTPIESCKSLAALIEWQSRQRGHSDALVTTRERLTYGQLWKRALQTAAGLRRLGVGEGDRVALLAENSSLWVEVAVAVSALGAELIAVNTWVRTWELEGLLTHARPNVLIMGHGSTDDDLADLLTDLVPAVKVSPASAAGAFAGIESFIFLDGDCPAGARLLTDVRVEDPDFVPVLRPSHEVGLVMYSSGSTAAPKAVGLSAADVVVNGYWIGERLGLTPADTLLIGSPLFWAYGGPNAMYASLTHGATVVLPARFEAGAVLDLIETEGCTAIYLLPAMTDALVRHPQFRPERVRALVKGETIGSAEDVRRVIEELGVTQICNAYGSSETYGNCCATPYDATPEERQGSHGPALPGYELRIVDPKTREELQPGELGELLVRGRTVPGYLDGDWKTQSILDDEGYFATGDMGYVDDRGWFTYAARANDMIKTNGINVSPAEVEAFIATHPAVGSCAVVGIAHPIKGQSVVAFVTVAPDHTLSGEALREWSRGKIASFKVPSKVFIVDDLPTTSTGKLLRRELVARAEAGARA